MSVTEKTWRTIRGAFIGSACAYFLAAACQLAEFPLDEAAVQRMIALLGLYGMAADVYGIQSIAGLNFVLDDWDELSG